ncbi:MULTISPECIES: hypothetical protein [Streptococcus]|uniref:Uncharacterized protein n=1 Tax=Streptococcus caledonicus TaxID=2614158 RepID=A0ABW0UGJ4_9STRE|nr:hypothetical protein [Streptococcus sp. S784/96/1]
MSQYDTIIAYLEKFGSAPYGDWHVSDSDKKIQTFPFINYNPIVNSFIKDFYQ